MKELRRASDKLSVLWESGLTVALEKFVQKNEIHALEGVRLKS